jgi:hypothetical protein
MAALQPVLSPSSILLPPSCHFAFIVVKKVGGNFKSAIISIFSYFFKKKIMSEIA